MFGSQIISFGITKKKITDRNNYRTKLCERAHYQCSDKMKETMEYDRRCQSALTQSRGGKDWGWKDPYPLKKKLEDLFTKQQIDTKMFSYDKDETLWK